MRRIAPRLPGFSTPSMTTTSGSAGSARRSSERSRDPDDGDQPLGPFAEGELLEDALAGRDGRDAGGPQRVERRPRVGARQERLADEHLDDLDAGVDAPGGPRARRRRAVRPVRSRSRRSRRAADGRDPRVGEAGQVAAGWGRASAASCPAGRAGRRRRARGAGHRSVSRASSPASTERRRSRRGRRRGPGPAGRHRTRACARSAARSRRARGCVRDRDEQAGRSSSSCHAPPVGPCPYVGGSSTIPRVAPATTGLALGERDARRRRSSGSGRSARPDSSALRRAQATVGRDASTWVTDAPAAASASVTSPVYANRLRTGAAGRAASPRSHGSIAACSGNRPTWPASVGRSSSVRPSSSIGHGPSRRQPGRVQPRSRSNRRSAPATARDPGARPSAPGAAGRRCAGRTARGARRRRDRAARSPSGRASV